MILSFITKPETPASSCELWELTESGGLDECHSSHGYDPAIHFKGVIDTGVRLLVWEGPDHARPAANALAIACNCKGALRRGHGKD